MRGAFVSLCCDEIACSDTVDLYGMATPGAEVVISVDGEETATAEASSEGAWYATIVLAGVKFGEVADIEASVTAEGETSTDYAVIIYQPDLLLPGDIDGDGFVTAEDARLARRCALKLVQLADVQLFAGDVNADGIILMDDARQILRYSGMVISEFETDDPLASETAPAIAPDFDRRDNGEDDLIKLDISDDAVDGGIPSNIFVKVSAEQTQGLTALNLYFLVESSRLSFAGYEKGETGLVEVGDCEGQPGLVSVSFATETEVEEDNMDLCTLKFKVLKPGTTGIDFVATNWNGAAFPNGGGSKISMALGACGADAQWFVEADDLIISGNGDMNDYGIVGDVAGPPAPWVEHTDLISDVTNTVVLDGITRIGNRAMLPGETVYLPLSLKSISGNAIASANDIHYAGTKEQFDKISIDYDNPVLKNAVVHCEDGSFSVELPRPSAGEGLTWDLDKDGVLTVSGNGSINGSSMGEFYNISAWQYEDTKVKTAVLEDGVTGIGANVFRYDNLTSVTIPVSVTEIGSYAFPDSLKEIHYQGTKEQWDKIDIADHNENLSKTAVIYVGDTVVKQTGSCGESVSYTLDSDGTLTIIGSGPMTDYEVESPFSGNAAIKNVIIEDGVASVGDYAFAECTGITHVTIPDSVKTIGTLAFDGCSGLGDITIPDGIASLGLGSLRGCTGLTTVTIPGSVKLVGDRLFSLCAGLECVVISNGIEEIDEDAFLGCTALKKVIIPPTVTKIGKEAIPADAVITGVAGSYAQQWAQENNRVFEELPKGDVNGDGKVLAADARLALRNSAKLETLEDWQIKAADVDGSGEVLADDARQILRFSAKLQDGFFEKIPAPEKPEEESIICALPKPVTEQAADAKT